jgi:hypothetical protein
MRYYTYKVTFKDLPGYFYYGVHKDNGKPYFGSPKTWKHLWSLFEPEVQVLQRYSTVKEAKAAEDSVIKATWADKYSLNEHYGGNFSGGVCRKNGKKTGPANGSKTGPANAAANFTPEVRSKNGRTTGPANAAANFTPEVRSKNGSKYGADNGRKRSKSILLTSIANGDSSEFPSVREACRALGLNRGVLWSVVNGDRKSHKGYTAMYL